MGETIGLGQLRSNACGYLERVLTGETIEVVRRGRLVARIVSAAGERPVPTTLPDLVAVNGAGGRIGLDALRKRAGRCLDRVEAGETVWIVWQDKLVARIESAANDGDLAAISRRAAKNPSDGAAERVRLDELRTSFFDRIAQGETIEVVRRGKVVARMVSAGGDPRRSA
ncbi:type II toxin-antitoxin system prevent-host-death family antitoxin [Mycobacterium sp. 1245852.3]|uniref:type II toxin-antitoxin system prevent-host-death family antitoxin n=1 Tax=Mycobacterium sp. 1245852.3 TaxID=1856860 RepID=UPI0012EAAF6D|nr:type II toxin-antitoxin system prevent-host-death family antitoxin [Mycobacterium sp. 1245852.3]